MVSIQLQTDGTETLNEIDDYSQGHIKIEGRNGIISSEKANQSMMIFLTVTDFLDGYRMFIANKHETIHEFLACDTSFTFYLIKHNKKQTIKIENRKGKIIDELGTLELAQCIWKSSQIFFDTYVKPKNNWDFAKDDLTNAMKDFANYFRLDM